MQDATKDTSIELFSIQQWGTIHFFQRQWKKSLTFKITRRNVCCGLKCCSTKIQRFNWLQHAEYILKYKTFLWLFWIHCSFSDYSAGQHGVIILWYDQGDIPVSLYWIFLSSDQFSYNFVLFLWSKWPTVQSEFSAVHHITVRANYTSASTQMQGSTDIFLSASTMSWPWWYMLTRSTHPLVRCGFRYCVSVCVCVCVLQ